jgi:hypothetical protein
MNRAKKPWADEPTPLCDEAKVYADCDDSCLDIYYHNMADRSDYDGGCVRADVAENLERRLRHAWKLVNSLRIDAIHQGDPETDKGWMTPEELEQRLGDIEEVLQ